MLHAVGIASELVTDGRYWMLLVQASDASTAAAQLRRYDFENPPRRRPAEPDPPHRGAWLGSAGYAAVMLLVAYLAGVGAFNGNWLDAGALLSVPVRHGEIYRAVTALTLHLDVGHLLANLGFGTVFGLLAGQILGPGVAWASILAAAAAANLLNAFIQPEMHASVGASTAVFATLGMLAGFEWRQPGCSMCLAMNNDKLGEGEHCASTSNRNFEGRQGFGGRTHLVGPAMAAAAAIAGHFVDIRQWR